MTVRDIVSQVQADNPRMDTEQTLKLIRKVVREQEKLGTLTRDKATDKEDEEVKKEIKEDLRKYRESKIKREKQNQSQLGGNLLHVETERVSSDIFIWNNYHARVIKCDHRRLPTLGSSMMGRRVRFARFFCTLELDAKPPSQVGRVFINFTMRSASWDSILGEPGVLRDWCPPVELRGDAVVDAEGYLWDMEGDPKFDATPEKVLTPGGSDVTSSEKGVTAYLQQPPPVAETGNPVDMKSQPVKKEKRTHKAWTDNARKNVAKLWFSYRSESPNARLIDCFDAHKGTDRLHADIKTFEDFNNCVGAAKKAKIIPVRKKRLGKVAGSLGKTTGKPRQ